MFSSSISLCTAGYREMLEAGRLVSTITCCVEYRSAWIWKIGFCCHMLWGIEVPETGRLSSVMVCRSTLRWKTTNPEFFTHACPNACCLSENVYESNRISPIVWTEKGSAWNNTSVSAIINSTMVEYQALHIWRSRWSVLRLWSWYTVTEKINCSNTHNSV